MNTRRHWGLLTLALALVFVATQSLSAQTTKYGTYYYQRAHLFETLPTSPDDIIFLGNSITDGGEWGELFGNINVKNRGISGDICDGILDRLSTITNGHPAKVFLMIGVNDMARDFTPDSIAYKVGLIVRRIKTESPETKVYVQSVLPVSDEFGLFSNHGPKWRTVPVINTLLQQVAEREGVTYIDLFSVFATEEGKMNAAYSNDGLHLTGAGYKVWRDLLLEEVNGEKPEEKH